MTPEQNKTLMHVGPGTPMGNYMRSHWIPALRAARLEPGGAPVRSRLLGENFVAFRATDGRVGFVDEACPHRGISLALARNCGTELQCLFHGWKIGTDGRVAETPLVPYGAQFASKIKTRLHKVVETGNMIWVYLGGGDAPPFPAMGFAQDPKAIPRAAVVHCNWLQLQEGTLDPNHVAHLHGQWIPEVASALLLTTPPSFEIDDKPYGFTAASIRSVGTDMAYVRVKEVMLPFAVDIPFDPDIGHTTILSVPIDDDTAYLWYIGYADSGIVDEARRAMSLKGATLEMSEDDMFWHGVNSTPGLVRNPDNFRDSMPFDPERLWGQDRAAMAAGHHTGLPGLVLEDIALSESAGRQLDRTRENLNVTDAFVMRYRRSLLAAIKAHADATPRPPIDYSRVRARDGFVPTGRNWRELPIFPGEPKLVPLEQALTT